jgi:hypothetical protein
MHRAIASLFVLVIFAASGASGDTLELIDGRRIEGKFRGGSSEMLHFEIDGVLRAVPVGDVVSVRLPGADSVKPQQPASAGPAQQATGPAQQAAAAPQQPAPVRVAAGTRLRVRLLDALDPRISTAGDRFSALLETELQHEGRPVVPAQSRVTGRVAEVRTGPMGGLSLELTELKLAGRPQPIVTGTQQPVASGAEAPAAPAAPADRIPAGALLEFRLLQPFDVTLP